MGTWTLTCDTLNRLSLGTQAPGGVGYDAAGNLTNDVVAGNQYLYDGVPVDRSSSTGQDAEGRICAVFSSTVSGAPVMTGYIYDGVPADRSSSTGRDAEGTRVAKGSITTWSCNPGINGFQTTNDYILGPGGEQMTEMGVNTTTSGSTTTNTLVRQHNNVWAGGKLLATYDSPGNIPSLHFYFDDPLGTRRVQTDYAGVIERQCQSLPYGDGESCAPTPTEHLFTGKERDTESGNDYFGARYYSSAV
jgi:hypothetical protein